MQVVLLSGERSMPDVLDVIHCHPCITARIPAIGIFNRHGGQDRSPDNDACAIDTAPHPTTGQLIHEELAAGTLDMVVSFQKLKCRLHCPKLALFTPRDRAKSPLENMAHTASKPKHDRISRVLVVKHRSSRRLLLKRRSVGVDQFSSRSGSCTATGNCSQRC